MRKLGVLTIVIMSVAALAGAQEKKAGGAAEKKTPAGQEKKAGGNDAAAIGEVRTAYVKAAEASDAAALVNLFAADGVEMPPNAPEVKGRAALEAFYKEQLAQVKFSNMKITPTKTSVMGNFGFDAGVYAQRVTPTGGKPMDDKGKYIVILDKASDGWKIKYLIYNSDLPAPPPPPAPTKKK
jgi:uncharacterized protein (TIGR02246 family)